VLSPPGRWANFSETSLKKVLGGASLIELKNGYQKRPLHLAAGAGHIDVVRLLLEKGASKNPGDETGETPLHHASKAGHIKVVSVLLEKGANVNAQNRIGWTPLYLAARGGHAELVRSDKAPT
jgi:ankyrin repeat protein